MTINVLPEEREYEPTWAIAELFPAQGQWSKEEYLSLETNRLVEYSHGELEILKMPTPTHQLIVLFLYRVFWAFISENQLGELFVAPCRVQLWPEKFREPDIVFLHNSHADKRKEQYLTGADLAVEVISPDDRKRDLVIKRHEYALAGISEYWIIDQQNKKVIVLTLNGDNYQTYGEFISGEIARSRLLSEFSVTVDAIFNAGN